MSEIGCAGVKLQERPRSRNRQRRQPVRKSRPQLQGQAQDRRLKDSESRTEEKRRRREEEEDQGGAGGTFIRLNRDG